MEDSWPKFGAAGLGASASSCLWSPLPSQCSTFTGMRPVFGVLLILFGWYWYVVCESGMRVIDSCSGQPLELHRKREARFGCLSVFLRFAPRSWSSHDSSIMEPPAEDAPVDAPKRCGNPDCPDPTSTSRLQLLPKEFTGKCVPGAKHFHRQKGKCARWCGFKGPPKKAGRKRTAETMAIPVGKQLDADRCPPILRSIDELWGYRCTSPAPHGTPLYTHSLTRAYSHAQAIRH